MYRVLIADDENWIRKNISKMIPWERLGLELAAEATNGIEALELAEKAQIDIVITDVRMPGLDGLQLAERLLALDPSPRVIIVSGYDEFEYAKKAIDLKVVSYILKPIDEAKLIEKLSKLIEELDKSKENQALKENLPYLRAKIASDLLESGDAESIARFIRWIAEKEPAIASFTALIITFELSDYDMISLCDQIQSVSEEICGNTAALILFERKDGLIGAVAIIRNPLLDSETFFRRFSTELVHRNLMDIALFLGDTVRTPSELQNSYRKAIDSMNRRHHGERNLIVAYRPTENATEARFPFELQNDVIAAITLLDPKRFEQSVLQIERYIEETEGLLFQRVRWLFFMIGSDIVKLIQGKERFDVALVSQGIEFCGKIDSYHEPDTLIDWLRSYGCEVLSYFNRISSSDFNSLIDEAVTYIHANYQKYITLNELASLYHVNSSYFSTMFHRIKGIGFIEYLTQVRIEKAKEHLILTSANISRIGAMVGYEDVRYFGKVFKKNVGCMPSEYRIQYSSL